MELSERVDWLEKPFEGYVVSAEFSDENAAILESLINEIQIAFGGAVFCMPRRSLHITLLDWVAPLVDYDGQDKAKLYQKVKTDYDKAMNVAIADVGPIAVQFDELKVSPSTIFVQGRDNGQLREIRDRFVENVELLPGTKLPPQIIHSSLARFTRPIDLKPVREFAHKTPVNFTQVLDGFRLVHSMREPMLEFEVLKRYELN